MHGARDALAAGLAHVEEQVRSIERAVVENPALAFDLARTLVESACRTILTERRIAYNEDEALPKLFKTVCSCVPFLPPTASEEAGVRKSLTQTLGGLSMAIHGICELRNQCGFASHGSDQARPPMEGVQALLAAEAADTIVGFLHRVHCQDRTPPPSPRALYEGNQAFNDAVDETYGPIRIVDVELKASDVLFQLEPESYRIYAAEFDEETGSAAAAAAEVVPEAVL
jgi:hypothetical protein